MEATTNERPMGAVFCDRCGWEATPNHECETCGANVCRECVADGGKVCEKCAAERAAEAAD